MKTKEIEKLVKEYNKGVLAYYKLLSDKDACELIEHIEKVSHLHNFYYLKAIKKDKSSI